MTTTQYDVVIVGSGTAGATLARQLTLAGQKVAVLEQGKFAPLKESFWGIASIADEVKVGDKMSTIRANTTGGSTGLYFGVVDFPNLTAFNDLGIDLSKAQQRVKDQLPIAPLPDDLIAPQSLKLRDSAIKLGFDWRKNEMLIDQSQCQGQYNFDARWRARSYLEQAVEQGATLIEGAKVQKVLVADKQAVGVEYQVKKGLFSRSTETIKGNKIIICAGSAATPELLINSGLSDIGRKGFYCDPGYPLFGIVPGMEGKDNFIGSFACDLDEHVCLGDANLSKVFYRLAMLASLKFGHMFKFEQGLGIGVKIFDELGGSIDDNGKMNKPLTDADRAKLKKGEKAAIEILKQAGATKIFTGDLTSAGHVGGLVRIGEDIDANLQTRVPGLYVCDGSVIPETSRGTPTVPILCLAEYLAEHLRAC